MNDDAILLRQFAEKRDEVCFRKIVERRIGFVYAVNLRRLRDPHLAQEATQAVFIALARKAARVAESPNVMGWLHRSSCYESSNLLRAQANRRVRETEAAKLGEIGANPLGEAGRDHAAIGAVLDEILCELPAADRDAILARFFSDASYAEIAASTGRTENAARMRVERALAKLRERLERRGLASTAAVLAGTLPAYASVTVPAPLTTTISQVALAGLAAPAIPVFFAFMNATKITTTIAVLAVAGVIGFEFTKTRQLEHDLVALSTENAAATKSVRDLETQLGAINARAVTSTKAIETAGAATPAATTPPLDTPGITRKAPEGWHKNGSNPSAYDVGVDYLQSWGGMPSAYAKSIAASAEGFGGMMQSTSADAFHNKRVKLTGWIKTEDAKEGGQLWLRVDGPNPNVMLGFDNMNARAPRGTTDWQEYSIVLDVPNEATSLNYGFFVKGAGKMWVNGVTIAPVDSAVPATNMLTEKPKLPEAPVNLGFKPN